MTRGFVVMLVVVATTGCMQSHTGQEALHSDECYTCHRPDYETTVAPNMAGHQTSGFPTTCANCHVTAGWQPALGGLHPDVVVVAQDFGIKSGPHTNIKCLTCHDLSSPQPATDGANTNCVQCHADSSSQRTSHAGTTGTQPGGAVVAYADIAYSSPNFCLTCHPNGLAGKHPDDKFPRRGEHNAPCVQCHDRTTPPPNNTDMMGKNVNCMASGCHSRSRMDSKHAEEPGTTRYNASKNEPQWTLNNFCLDCHPSGGGGD